MGMNAGKVDVWQINSLLDDLQSLSCGYGGAKFGINLAGGDFLVGVRIDIGGDAEKIFVYPRVC